MRRTALVRRTEHMNALFNTRRSRCLTTPNIESRYGYSKVEYFSSGFKGHQVAEQRVVRRIGPRH